MKADDVVWAQTMHPSTLLLAVFATPLLALASVTDGSSAIEPAPRLKRQAPHLRSQRSTKQRSTRRTKSSPFIESSSRVALTQLSTRSDKNAHLHPQVLLQQHIHRGIKRHARMTKRSLGENAEEEMVHKMVKRWESVESSEEPVEVVGGMKKKRWLGGVALAGATETVQQIQDRLSRILSKDRLMDQNSTTTLPGPGAPGLARYGVSGYAGASIAKLRNSKANETDSTSGTKSDNTQDGYSEVDLEAASTNRITQASTPTAINSLGLAIEANDVGEFSSSFDSSREPRH